MVTTENKQAWKRRGWRSRRWAGSDMTQAGLEHNYVQGIGQGLTRPRLALNLWSRLAFNLVMYKG